MQPEKKDVAIVQEKEVDPDVNAGTIENDQGLKRNLKTRHLLWISVGNSIGLGLWLGSGTSLHTGGPASIFIGYCIAASIVCFLCVAAGELSILYPVPSPFPQWCQKFLDPAAAVTLGFSYFFAFSINLANELQGCTTAVSYWTDKVPTGAWLTIFLVYIVFVNACPSNVFGEAESVMSCVKLLWIFVVIGGCIYVSAANHVGFHYWNVNAFPNGFKGLLSVFSTCVFAIAGSELIAVAAAEVKNPRRSVPPAVNSAFLRLGLFYVIGSLMVTITVDPDNKQLFGGGSDSGSSASPFVIAFKDGPSNIRRLGDGMNAIILLSALSSGCAQAYGGSRQLIGLAKLGLAPQILNKTDKHGRPWTGILAILVFGGGLSYLNVSETGANVFGWFSNLTSLCTLWVWSSIFFCHIRMRLAWKAQGRSFSELPWRGWSGIWGSLYGLTWCILIVIIQFYIALFPLGEKPSAKNFFANFVSLVALVIIYCGARVYFYIRRRSPMWVPASQVDLETGRMEYPVETKSPISNSAKRLTGKIVGVFTGDGAV